MELKDTYRTVAESSEGILFKEKKSKFYGYVFPIKKETEVKPILERLQKQFPNANHFCFSWHIGIDHPIYRINDDGEPKNTAGMHIYGQIQSFDVTNILVVIVRIFGGTKLGTSGLISAYRNTAKLALEEATITEKIIKQHLLLHFEYAEMNTVMRFIKKQQLELLSQKMELTCKVVVAVRRKNLIHTLELLGAYHKIKFEVLD